MKPAVEAIRKARAEMHLDVASKCTLADEEQYQSSLSKALAECAEIQPKVDDLRAIRAEMHLAVAVKYTLDDEEQYQSSLSKALSECAGIKAKVEEVRKNRAGMHLTVANECTLDAEEQYQKSLSKALSEFTGIKPEVEKSRKARAEQFLAVAEGYAEKGDKANCEANLQKALDERGDIGPKVEKARAEMYLALASKWSLAYDEQYQSCLKKALAECTEVKPQVEAIRKARAEMHLAVAAKCTLADEEQYQSSLSKALSEFAGIKSAVQELRHTRAEQFVALSEEYAQKGDKVNCEVNLQKALDEHAVSVKRKVDKLKWAINLYSGIFNSIDHAVNNGEWASVYELIEPLKEESSNYAQWAAQQAKAYAIDALQKKLATLSGQEQKLQNYL